MLGVPERGSGEGCLPGSQKATHIVCRDRASPWCESTEAARPSLFLLLEEQKFHYEGPTPLT